MPEMLLAAIQTYETAKRGTGRTTRMLDLIDPEKETIILAPAHEVRFLNGLLKERGLEKVKVLGRSSIAHAGNTMQGTRADAVLFTHCFCMQEFMKAISNAKADFSYLQSAFVRPNNRPEIENALRRAAP